MSTLGVAAWTLVILGLGQLAALLGVMYRHAIPRAPRFFRVLLLAPMLLSSATCFALGWLALTGGDGVFGMSALLLLAIYFAAQAFTWWIFVAYAVYHHHIRGTYSRHIADDTNTRIREMQARGLADRPLEEADREEGRGHRKPESE